MSKRRFKVGPVQIGGPDLFVIAGPCVIESRAQILRTADRLAELAAEEEVPLIFKASFDKANRTSVDAFRGPGLEKGLDILAEVKDRTGLPLLTDVHTPEQVAPCAQVIDILQLPAFLCRQTDLVVALGESGKAVNLKKAQFPAAEDMDRVVKKVESTGNKRILLTERGTTFGYNNLVADFRNLLIMADTGYPVVFDATHSVQRPGGGGGFSSGNGEWAPHLARAATAVGLDGLFMETHLQPAKAMSDKDNLIPFRRLAGLWRQLKAIHAIRREG